jgi:hypothetical protein
MQICRSKSVIGLVLAPRQECEERVPEIHVLKECILIHVVDVRNCNCHGSKLISSVYPSKRYSSCVL